ncbi:MAG: zf-HC2 domain-containing protein [Candidatus Zixiibacteriota bacterium]
MRCQKVRSCLSAYCKDELSGRRLSAVVEHLSDCSGCRTEAGRFRTMFATAVQLPQVQVSKNFNTDLLNRIAHERFAETRTKAFLPRPVRRMEWGRLAPVAVTVCLVLVGAVTMTKWTGGNQYEGTPLAQNAPVSDDSYLTAQPTRNPNMTARLDHDWSLDRQLAQSDRIRRLSRNLIGQDGFALPASQHLAGSSVRSGVPAPYLRSYFRVRPLVKTYANPTTNSAKEVSKVY